MKNKCRVEIETPRAGIILKAISPELKKEISKRSKVSIKAEKNKIILSADAIDTNALRAAVNNLLRLIIASEQSMKIR